MTTGEGLTCTPERTGQLTYDFTIEQIKVCREGTWQTLTVTAAEGQQRQQLSVRRIDVGAADALLAWTLFVLFLGFVAGYHVARIR